MSVHVWKRPSLPGDHNSVAYIGGLALMGCGLLPLLAVFGSSNNSPEALASFTYAAAGFIGTGFPLWLVGLVINELRRRAFEEALRSGEVQVEEAAK